MVMENDYALNMNELLTSSKHSVSELEVMWLSQIVQHSTATLSVTKKKKKKKREIILSRCYK